MLADGLLSCHGHNKGSQTGRLKTRETDSLTVLQAGKLKASRKQGWFLLEALRGSLFHARSQASGGCPQSLVSLAGRFITPISASVVTRPSPCVLPVFLFSFLFFLRFYLFNFRQRGRVRERGRNINVWLPLSHPLLGLGTWTATQGCALHWELNR